MTTPDPSAAPGTEAGDPGLSIPVPVVEVQMAEMRLPPPPDLAELTGIRLPELPTPQEFFDGLPPLPPLDLNALMQPLMSQMQLLGSGVVDGPWGTGDTSAGGGLSGLFSLSQTLADSLSTGGSALSALQAQWEGEGARATSETGHRVEEDKRAVKTQGEQIAATVRVGAGIINHGNVLLKAVATRLASTLAALAPTSVTPAGQAAMVSAIAQATAEANTIISTTEAELVPPTQHMLSLGQPVPVEMPPGAELAQVQQLAQTAQKVISPVREIADRVTGGEELSGVGADGLDPYSATAEGLDYGDLMSDPADADLTGLASDDLSSAWEADSGGPGVGGMGAAPMLGAAGAGAGALGMAGARGSMPASTVAATPEAAPSARPAGATGGAQPMMAPMGGGAGAAGAAGRGGGDGKHDVPDFLVTAAHGDEVIGDQPAVAPGVLGGDPHPGGDEFAGHEDDGVDSTTLNM